MRTRRFVAPATVASSWQESYVSLFKYYESKSGAKWFLGPATAARFGRGTLKPWAMTDGRRALRWRGGPLPQPLLRMSKTIVHMSWHGCALALDDDDVV